MPTLELVYGDGTIYGNGYMEVWIDTSRENISGNKQIRETFTVSGGDKIASVSPQDAKDNGADPLTVYAKNAGGGND